MLHSCLQSFRAAKGPKPASACSSSLYPNLQTTRTPLVSKRRYTTDKKDGNSKEDSSNSKDHTKEHRKPGERSTQRISPETAQIRQSLSILSPANNLAFDLGSNACVLYAGPEAKVARYASWPNPDSCKLIPRHEGASAVRAPGMRFSGDPLMDAERFINVVSRSVSRPDVLATTRGTWGTVHWKVRVGDIIQPNEPFLVVGDTTFYNQPARKGKNPTLYVANLILKEGTDTGPLMPGSPLLVAVFNERNVARYEFFLPPNPYKQF